jgi:hypothetical protein
MKPGPEGNVVDTFAKFINSPHRTKSSNFLQRSKSLVYSLDLAEPQDSKVTTKPSPSCAPIESMKNTK